MEKFKVGDIVHVVKIEPLMGNMIAPPLFMNEEKEILRLTTCQCGKDHLDVGLISKFKYISCFNCEQELPEGDKTHWCHPSRFAHNL